MNIIAATLLALSSCTPAVTVGTDSFCKGEKTVAVISVTVAKETKVKVGTLRYSLTETSPYVEKTRRAVIEAGGTESFRYRFYENEAMTFGVTSGLKDLASGTFEYQC